MTVMVPVSMINSSNPYTQVYLEMYYDTDQTRFHFRTNEGHIDGFYIFSFDKEFFGDNKEFHFLKLWTSVGSRMKNIDLVGRSQLKIIGVDLI